MKLRLFALATFIILIFTAQNFYGQEMMNHKKDGQQFMMFQKLNLSDTQKDQISKLRISHQMQMVDLNASLQLKKLELAKLKNNGNYSRDQYLVKIEAINSARDQIEISKANFQMDVYQFLDDTQKTQWNKYSQFFSERNGKRMKRQMKDSGID